MTNLVQVIKIAGPKMVPFLKSVTIYFLLVTSDHRGKVWSTVLKCAPIVCLMIFALLYGIKFFREFNYAHKILLGLIFSCVGDALLNWNLFPHGMGAFAVAQIFYISAFGFRPLKLWIGIVMYVLGGAFVVVLHKSLDTVLLVGLPIYSCLLLTMVWRAIARLDGMKESNIAKWTCAVGGLLFVTSDALIAFDKFYSPIEHSQIFIMTTYYAAQFGITLSIVNIKHETTETQAKLSQQTTPTRGTDSELQLTQQLSIDVKTATPPPPQLETTELRQRIK